jgi:hypothetical protein
LLWLSCNIDDADVESVPDDAGVGGGSIVVLQPNVLAFVSGCRKPDAYIIQ